ncbi:MAG TPA: CHAT domain-containing tetratricopeptide repeat protein [Longimicrobium sp.]|nr:CHAT domain-containing tetratricopeptide repeat protein [Longimicrobium sp.]
MRIIPLCLLTACIATTHPVAGQPRTTVDSALALGAAGDAARDRATAAGRDDAIRLWTQALEVLPPSHSPALTLSLRLRRAATHAEQRDFASAMREMEELRPLARGIRPRTEASVLLQMAHVQKLAGRPGAAVALYREALAIARASEDDRLLPTLLSAMGVAQSDAGRPDSALDYGRRAVVASPGASADLHSALNNLGTLFERLGYPDSAAAAYRRALAIPLAGRAREMRVIAMGNLAEALAGLGMPDSAVWYYQAALDSARQMGLANAAAVLTSNLGRLHEAGGRPREALAAYQASLASLRAQGDTPGIAVALHNVGGVHLSDGDPDSALAYVAEARRLSRAVGDPWSEAGILATLGMAQLRRRSPDPAAAAAAFDTAAALRASVRRHGGADVFRMNLSEQAFDGSAAWALAWLARAPQVGARRSALAALGAVERGRAQALLDLLQDADAGTHALFADTLPGADLEARTDALLRELTRGGTAVVSYLARHPDTVFVWLATPDGDVRVWRQPGSLPDLAAALRWTLAGSGRGARAAFAVEDSMTLVRPAVQRLVALGRDSVLARTAALLLPPDLLARVPPGMEVLVVPNGAVGVVPFAALPVDTLPLGVRNPLRYAPSLSIAAAAQARPDPLAAGADGAGALVVGDPAMPVDPGTGQPFAPLADAREEAAAVAARLHTAVLTGAAATESAVRGRLSGATLVHLATHGLAYGTADRERESLVALAPDGVHDGRLTVGELMDDPALGMHASLVVLSACETGVGNLRMAEGSVGLQRALLARGARSVIVSLWQVPDASTRMLMERFYAHWLDGARPAGKAEALRWAQEEVRREYPDPRHWAGFQLVGAP